MRRFAWLVCCILTGCFGDADFDSTWQPPGGLGQQNGILFPGFGDGGMKQGPTTDGGPTGGGGGLPCDVADVLAKNCQSCHRSPPVGGAPMPLLSYADLTAESAISPGQKVYDRVLARMKDAARPMPIGGMLPPDQIKIIEDWIAGGALEGTCGGGGDGGTLPIEVVCTSGRHWDDPDDGSPQMNPGRACITCHSQQDDEDALDFWIGGTVFPTQFEEDACYGADGDGQHAGATVVVSDEQGNELTALAVNGSGNFMLRKNQFNLQFPIKVKVVYDGRERKMNMSPPHGNCNECHTETGANGAPGRIFLP